MQIRWKIVNNDENVVYEMKYEKYKLLFEESNRHLYYKYYKEEKMMEMLH